MSGSCPILTPAERRATEILQEAGLSMMMAIEQVIREVKNQAADRMAAIGLEKDSPAFEYYAAVAHQGLFLRLCGAYAQTLKGGDPVIAEGVIRNSRNIVDHYWKDQEAESSKP